MQHVIMKILEIRVFYSHFKGSIVIKENYILSSLVNNLIPSYSSNILVKEKCECSAPVHWRP